MRPSLGPSHRLSVGGVCGRFAPGAMGECVHGPLNVDLLSSWISHFSPLAHSHLSPRVNIYTHTLKCTVIRSGLGGCPRPPGVRLHCWLLSTQPTHKIEISEHEAAGKGPAYILMTFVGSILTLISFSDTTKNLNCQFSSRVIFQHRVYVLTSMPVHVYTPHSLCVHRLTICRLQQSICKMLSDTTTALRAVD